MSDLSDEQTPRRPVDFLAVVGSVLVGVGVTGCSGSAACNHASDVVAIQWAADKWFLNVLTRSRVPSGHSASTTQSSRSLSET
jgi:hypothetical protein